MDFKMDIFGVLLALYFVTNGSSVSSMPLPSYQNLTRYYPGYPGYGGSVHDNQLYVTSGALPPRRHMDTSALRMSVTLNKLGGEHSIDSSAKLLNEGNIDYTNTAYGRLIITKAEEFGPFLENKYHSPRTFKLNGIRPRKVVHALLGKRGIVRMAVYKYKMATARIALWDCDHFYQTRDWSLNRHLIAVDFWETPGPKCPPVE